MIKTRTLLSYALLLILPTLILAWSLKGMLEAEWARVDALSQEAAEAQSEACAGELRAEMETLLTELRALVPTVAGAHLEEAAAHPLVLAPFIRQNATQAILTPYATERLAALPPLEPPQREPAGKIEASFSKTRNQHRSTQETFTLSTNDSLLICRKEGAFTTGLLINLPAFYARLVPLLPQHLTQGYALTLQIDATALMQTGTPFESPTLIRTTPLSADFPLLALNLWLSGMPNGLPRWMHLLKMGVIVGALAVLAGAGVWIATRLYRSQLEVRRRTGFVSHVSHELRTPLTSIRLYAEMLREGRVPDTEKQRAYLETIVHESERLTRLVNRVLDFSRLEQKRRVYETEIFDPIATLARILETQRERLLTAGITLEADFETTSPTRITLDPDTFEQVILNLLDNAIKYAPAATLRISAQTDSNHLSLIFADTGPGIPPALRKNLFKPFTRSNAALTQTAHGFGLGLYLSRRLLLEQGATLTFTPAHPRGAMFTLTLPITQEA